MMMQWPRVVTVTVTSIKQVQSGLLCLFLSFHWVHQQSTPKHAQTPNPRPKPQSLVFSDNAQSPFSKPKTLFLTYGTGPLFMVGGGQSQKLVGGGGSKIFRSVESRPRGVTQVKTFVNMHVRMDFKWTHISEYHDRRITPFSEPLPTGSTLNSEFIP